MDIKTERRIAQYKAQQREKRAVQRQLSGKASVSSAERARKERMVEAKKRRPGFGSSSSSVADHLNEVCGLTEHKLSKREERDRRIEQAAKEGHGCRRFEVAASRASGSGGGNGYAFQAIAPRQPRSRAVQATRAPSTVHRLGGGGSGPANHPHNSGELREARAAFLARLEAKKGNNNEDLGEEHEDEKQ